MGLLLVLALGLYGFVAGLVILLIARYLTKNIWVIGMLIVTAVLIPTYDIILTNVLSTCYCSQEPNPKTLISKKVEYPESIYWEDNVYPGFSKEDRALMITNYLDGKHLKTMALNGDDGKVYVYTLERPMWDELKQSFDAKKYKNIYDQYAQYIIDTSEHVYTKETMPKMNYTVIFDETRLHPFARKFLYSDETKVIENSTNEVIAYNLRYMRFFYNAFPDVALGNIYYPMAVCGEREPHLEYKVFNSYKWNDMHLGSHQRNLHEILIKRYKQKGEK